MDPYTALAFLMGLSSVVVTSDTITTVLLGVPGTVGSAATIMDGYPMARNGEAGRAFGAAFSASAIGGLFGAFLLAISIPILRPVLLEIHTPEMLGFCIFGLSIAASLSGGAPLKGLAGVCLGLLIATTGDDPQTGTLRWTFDLLYLWDGVGVIPLALGLFALPELADLAIQRTSIARPIGNGGVAEPDTRMSQMTGVRDTLENWWLTLRCAAIGSMLGAVPGIGTAVVDWVAYGHAARTEKGAADSFGKGDVRGVIASEAANNAKEGGSLVPTIAFGVPGSASMVLILGALLVHGLVPGPEMLTTRLDVTYTLVWSVALANVLGAGICFLFAHQLARVARVRIGVLAPVVLAIVFLGAYQGAHAWGDLHALIAFGVLGWVMKRLRWPRPPLLLGFVLGEVVEGYLFISFQLYEWAWMLRPMVLAAFAVALYGVVRHAMRQRGARRASATGEAPPRRRVAAGDLVFDIVVALIFAYALWISAEWELGARLMPRTIAWAGLGFIAGRVALELWAGGGAPEAAAGAHFDNVTDFGELSQRTIAHRALRYLAWCLFLLGAAWIIGLLPALAFFLIGYMRFEGGERWSRALAISLALWVFCYVLFHTLLRVPWPPSVIGDLFPALRSVASINLF